MAGLIDDYVAALRRELSFDPRLARRLAEEVEAHLYDAAEADPTWPSADAERRTVERFGLAREIAGEFASDAIERQSKRSWLALLATFAVTFVAMRLRNMWLGDMEETLSVMAPLVDRYAFVVAVVIGVIGWFAFRRSLTPLAMCLGALVASIAAGIVRAGLFVGGAPLHVLLAAAGEIVLIGVLAVQVLGLGARLRRTADLRRAK